MQPKLAGLKRLDFIKLATAAGWRWLVEIASGVGAVLLVLAAVGITAASGVVLPYWWLAFFVLGGLFGVLFFEGTYRVWREVERAAEAVAQIPRPHLVFGEPDSVRAGVVATFLSPSGNFASSGQPSEFVRITIANDPPEGQMGATAQRVVARISFRADDGSQPVTEMIGRWAETPQRGETGRINLSFDEAELDIAPNGLPHPVDVAMKHPGDPSCSAYNHENSTAPEMRLPAHELVDASYLVRVSVRAANTGVVAADYVLTNNIGVPLGLRGPYAIQEHWDVTPVS